MALILATLLLLLPVGHGVDSNTLKGALQDQRLLLALYRAHLPVELSHGLQSRVRLGVFRRSLQDIIQINSEQTSFRADVNFMSYYTDEERARYTGFNVTGLESVAPKKGHVTSERGPARVNWLESGHVTYVQDQGMCGSCWTFAGTGSVESRYALRTGTLKKFSEQEALECVYDIKDKDGCRGGQFIDQWKWIKKTQHQSSARRYPYKGKIYGCRSSWFPNQFTHARLTGHIQTESNYEAMQDALVSGPLAVGLRISRELYQYRSGVFVKKDCVGDGKHAVVAVGYTQDHFLLKNSWGTRWGESGFVKFSREIENMCDIATWTYFPQIERVGDIDTSECEDIRKDCEERKEECGTGVNWKIMSTGCAKTCGLCGCRDALTDCAAWAGEGYCHKPNYKEYMSHYCPLSCRSCDLHPEIREVEECKDSDKQCSHYNSRGYCDKYPEFMSTRCRLTCGLCKEKSCEDRGLVQCHGECRHAHMC